MCILLVQYTIVIRLGTTDNTMKSAHQVMTCFNQLKIKIFN